MSKRYNMVKGGTYQVAWLNPLEVQAYRVAGWSVTEYDAA